jgi:DNA-binding transcriptional ArsR family regulator
VIDSTCSAKAELPGHPETVHAPAEALRERVLADWHEDLAATSKHVKVLEKVGLVEQRVVGRDHICRLEAGPMSDVAEWLNFYERHWNKSLDALEALVATDEPKQEEKS